MTSSTAPYPPPLSATPTVGTLRELLDALSSGAYEVPPVPPLPTGAPTARPPSVRWRVEHVASGVPVQLSIGDDLDVDELRHLRDLLGARWWQDDRDADAVEAAPGPPGRVAVAATPAAVPPMSAPPTSAPAAAAEVSAAAPSLSWAAGEPTPTSAVAVASAVGAAVAAAAGAAARFLDVIGMP